MSRHRPPTLLIFLPLFILQLTTAIPSPIERQPDNAQDYENKVLSEEDLEEVESEEAWKLFPRRIDGILKEDPDDPYDVVEDMADCFWCDSEKPEDDDEFRAAAIMTYNIYIAPGDCLINHSPRYPARYPNNVDHRYTYTTKIGGSLTFFTPVGGLQISKGCHRDRLAIWAEGKVYKKCAMFYNFLVNSGASNQLYLRFAANHRIRWHGYNGTVCAAALPSTTTTTPVSTTTTSPDSTTTTTPPEPIMCDDICGNEFGYSRISLTTDAAMVYPWVLTLDVMRDKVFVRCSGYLISRKHLITSAFCFFQETPMGVDNVTVRVIAGEYDVANTETPAAQIIYANNVTLYDLFDFNVGGGVYNLAVVTLPDNGFELNSNVAPICMANATVQADLVRPFSNLILTGFGWSKYEYPVINMSHITLKACPFLLPDPDLICIFIDKAPATPCHGDAGAAIFERWIDGKMYAVGHVNAITVDSCPITGIVFPCPATAYYLSWINDVTGPRYCTPDH